MQKSRPFGSKAETAGATEKSRRLCCNLDSDIRPDIPHARNSYSFIVGARGSLAARTDGRQVCAAPQRVHHDASPWAVRRGCTGTKPGGNHQTTRDLAD